MRASLHVLLAVMYEYSYYSSTVLPKKQDLPNNWGYYMRAFLVAVGKV